MERGLYRKMNYEDKFARKYWCHQSKRRYVEFIKPDNNRRLRRSIKQEVVHQDIV